MNQELKELSTRRNKIKKYFWIFGSTVAILALGGLILASSLLINNGESEENKINSTEQIAYQYSYMSERCNQGISGKCNIIPNFQ